MAMGELAWGAWASRQVLEQAEFLVALEGREIAGVAVTAGVAGVRIPSALAWGCAAVAWAWASAVLGHLGSRWLTGLIVACGGGGWQVEIDYVIGLLQSVMSPGRGVEGATRALTVGVMLVTSVTSVTEGGLVLGRRSVEGVLETVLPAGAVATNTATRAATLYFSGARFRFSSREPAGRTDAVTAGQSGDILCLLVEEGFSSLSVYESEGVRVLISGDTQAVVLGACGLCFGFCLERRGSRRGTFAGDFFLWGEGAVELHVTIIR